MTDFWTVHGFGFILCMFFFPRLTLFFATLCGGIWWWLGLIFLPRITVAILATMTYFDTNPVLVVFTWIWAILLEFTEKAGSQKLADQ